MTTIYIRGGINGFVEDKNYAKQLRVGELLPALEKNEAVSLDFSQVQSATQSFIHALLGEALKRYQHPLLDRIEFLHCSPQVRTVIEIVVEYSLGGFEEEPPVRH